MSGIFWLASYPKSGNTWLRAWLTNYLRNADEAASINELTGGWTASLREQFDEIVGLESAALTEKQIAHFRPLVYEQMAAQNKQQQFIKIHDAFTYNDEGQPIFSPRATAGVIYIVRNPLDVAVSFAHHQNAPLDEIIRFMSDDQAALNNDGNATDQLPQKLLSWSQHVASWAEQARLKIHVVRYEDMMRQATKTFAGIARFIGFTEDTPRLEKAIAQASFAQLQAQESAQGFAEKQPTAPSFFRAGRSGSWREILTPAQAQQIITDHQSVMRRFGYLTKSDELID